MAAARPLARGGAAAGCRIPARLGMELGKVLRWELQGVQQEGLGGLDGSGSKRRGELGEAAAMAAAELGARARGETTSFIACSGW